MPTMPGMKYGLRNILLIILFIFAGSTLMACANISIEETSPVSLAALPVCYNANCKDREIIAISAQDWQKVSTLFATKHETALQERLAIRKAIAELETIAGKYTPTHNDLAANSNPQGVNGRMDCVDESTYTSNYLALLEQQGLLHWHTVESRAFRAHFFIDQHYTARIATRDTSTLYAVDSWHRDNGEPPLVQEYTAWLFKLGASKEENPD